MTTAHLPLEGRGEERLKNEEQDARAGGSVPEHSPERATASPDEASPETGGRAQGAVAVDTARLRRLADRVQAAHAWLWEGGREVDSHRMDCCDEDHAGCAHVSIVEMARAIATSHDELLAALKRIVGYDEGPLHSGTRDNYEWYGRSPAVWEAARAAIAKTEGQ